MTPISWLTFTGWALLSVIFTLLSISYEIAARTDVRTSSKAAAKMCRGAAELSFILLSVWIVSKHF